MSAPFESLEFAKEELAKCMMCGNCQEVCPTYYETKEEGSVARGKIKLVDALIKGLVDTSTKGLKHNLDMCLTCRACNDVCPCGVEIDKIILAGRAEVVRQEGLHPLKRAIFEMVDRPALLDIGITAGSPFQGTVFKREAKWSGFTPRFPFGLDMKRMIPDLADRPFRTTVPEVNVVVGEPKFRVAFFTGCASNYMYPKVAESFMNIMGNNQVEVVVPKEQHCCGAPILSHGDAALAKEMASDHVALFKDLDVDYILLVCGTCGLSFKEHYPDLLEGTDQYEDAIALADKVMDWSDFLVNVVKADFSDLHTNRQVVTYHDPCHLNRGIGVSQSPREILRQMPDIDFVEMKNPSRCCGSAGSFSITHYETSMGIQKKKFDDIQSTGADTVATGCGTCIMQMRDGQNQYGGKATVVHTIEILSDAYDRKNRKERIDRLKAHS